MKGKGKGKDQSNNKDCPLHFPDLSMLDFASCSKYSSILDQLDEEIVDLEDIDDLHSELTQLLLCTTKRKDKIEDEMQLLLPWINKKTKQNTKVEVESTSSCSSSSKKGRVSDPKPTKKAKDSPKAQPSPVGRPKSKNTQPRVQEDCIDSPSIPKNQKNDIPTRFWESLKPYYSDITPEQIKFLEEWAQPDDDSNFEIPPLGKHYSYDWSSSSVQDEEKEGAKPEKRKCLSTSSSMNSADSERILKKARTDYDSEEPCPFGPLTQRLVSCLIEENIITSPNDTIDNSKDLPETKPEHTNGNIIKSLNIEDPLELEQRIRRNLTIAGILPDEIKKEEEEEMKDEEEDEVLTELLSVQEKLRAISAHNLTLKQKLLKLAQKEVRKQELNKQLQAVDATIVKMHLKMREKPKKGSVTRKEEDKVTKILEQRRSLIESIKAEESS